MASEVILTGTGVPHIDPGRAGAGTLVVHEDCRLQFDAGRATTLRLAEAGVRTAELEALFITHHHSDHLTGLVDVVFTRWLENHGRHTPLTVVAPEGPSCRYVERMLEPWSDDIAVRQEHVHRPDGPAPRLLPFAAGDKREVWQSGDVRVSAAAVHHEPVTPAVAYRVETPAGVVAISGDTIVCDEMEALAAGADVLVHESFDRAAVEPFLDRLPHLREIAAYHANTPEIGGLAARAGVRKLVLTHLIPAPRDEAGEKALAEKVRAGGYDGEIIIGRDLMRIPIA